MLSPIFSLNDNKFLVEPSRGFSSSYPDFAGDFTAIPSENVGATNTEKAHLEKLGLNLNQSNDPLNDLMANLCTNTKLSSFPMIWCSIYHRKENSFLHLAFLNIPKYQNQYQPS